MLWEPSWFDFSDDIVCIFIKWKAGLMAHPITPPCHIQEYWLPRTRPVWSLLVNSFLPNNSSYRFYRQLAKLQVPQSRQNYFLKIEGKAFYKLRSLHVLLTLFPSKYSQRLSSNCLSTNCREALRHPMKNYKRMLLATLRTSALLLQRICKGMKISQRPTEDGDMYCLTSNSSDTLTHTYIHTRTASKQLFKMLSGRTQYLYCGLRTTTVQQSLWLKGKTVSTKR